MQQLFSRLRLHAKLQHDQPALRDGFIDLDYRSLLAEVQRLADLLPGQRVGLLLDNGAPWACLDLALLWRGSVCVPMPSFFTDEQLQHLMRDAQLDLVISDQPERMASLLSRPSIVEPAQCTDVAGQAIWLQSLPAWPAPAVALPAETVKIIYTSGTTGQPKGVCLSAAHVESVTAALCQAVQAGPKDRALSLLPLSTLLENIAGLYAPLWVGALAQIPPLSRCGVTGSSGLNTEHLFASLAEFNPTTLVLVPQLLKAVVLSTVTLPTLADLRFIAVGGAPVSPALLEQAWKKGLPVYQGYGLSEAGSVVSLNLPATNRPGSVGKPLPPHQLSLSPEGEILLREHLFLGYLGRTEPPPVVHASGDLGYLDEDGYLYLTGRKKTAYATAFGRNVAPEWLEGELCAHPLIAQAAVFGEGQTSNVAVLVSRAVPTTLDGAVNAINTRLPDYARIKSWLRADAPFSPTNGLANSLGSIRRDAIWWHYQTRLEHHFSNEERHAVL